MLGIVPQLIKIHRFHDLAINHLHIGAVMWAQALSKEGERGGGVVVGVKVRLCHGAATDGLTVGVALHTHVVCNMSSGGLKEGLGAAQWGVPSEEEGGLMLE